MYPYIMLEGPEGVGKTTQAKRLAAYLGREFLAFPRRRAAGHGHLIEKLLKDSISMQELLPAQAGPTNLPVDDRHMILQALMTWDKYAAYERLHAARSGDAPLVCDRGWPSAYVYGVLDGLRGEDLLDAHLGLPQPSISILLNVPLEEQVSRLRERNGNAVVDRYERDETLLPRMNKLYLDLWGWTGRRLAYGKGTTWVVVDGTGTEDEVHKRILGVVQP